MEAGAGVGAAPRDAPAATGAAGRSLHLLLGRVVNLGTMTVERTPGERAPEAELSNHVADFGATLQRDGTVEALQLSTGVRLWSQTPDAPCRTIAHGGGHVYAACGQELLSFGSIDGAVSVVDKSGVMQAFVAGSRLVTRRNDGPRNHGRVTLFDTATNKQLASKQLPELVRSLHPYLIPSGTAADRLCALGLFAAGGRPPVYKAGCYDGALARVWHKVLPADDVTPPLGVRQAGPHHLLLDDQSTPIDPSTATKQGRGLVVRLRDGVITPFDDGTFAILENAAGDRLPMQIEREMLAEVRRLRADSPRPSYREARCAAIGKRVFALVKNGSTGLVGVDAETSRVLFAVPVGLDQTYALEIAAGFPIVRTLFGDRWRASIHDPATGRVLYKDERPR
jgi:hypothetical protein